ncbi:MAG TPA: hypothetical protein VJY12_04245 [Dysgonamonadaceae bacterium]|nr:hypothetical protein [Dysgonamonadaceae bacterium]
MALSKKEIFDADIISNHYSGKYFEGKDPPDIYLEFNGGLVGIELTELNENLQDNRKSINMAYQGLLYNLDIPNFKLYKVTIYHANIKLNKKRRKEIINFLKTAVNNDKKCIDGVFVKLIIEEQDNKKGRVFPFCMPLDKCNRDIGKVIKNLAYASIDSVFKEILDKAIDTKKIKCKAIAGDAWLALHDNYTSYFNFSNTESIDLYNEAMLGIDFGIFKKILIIYTDGNLIEFNARTT